MNRLKDSLSAKLTAIIMFIVLTVVFIFASIGIAYMVSENAYIDNGKRMKDNIIQSYCDNRIHDIYTYFNDSQEELTNDGKDNGFYFNKNLIDTYSREKSNFFFNVTDEDGGKLFSNFEDKNYVYSSSQYYSVLTEREAHTEVISFETYKERWQTIEDWQNKKDKYNFTYDYYDEDTDNDGEAECVLRLNYDTGIPKGITITGYICKDLSAYDDLYYSMHWVNILLGLKVWLIVIDLLSLIIVIILFIFLLCSCGHKSGVEGIHFNWADRIPFDLYLLLYVFIFYSLYNICDGYYSGGYLKAVVIAIFFAYAVFGVLAVILSFATRTKSGSWWKNTIVYKLISLLKRVVVWILHGLHSFITSVPVITKTVIISTLICFLNAIAALCSNNSGVVLFWFIETIVLLPIVFWMAISFKRLKKGIEDITAGDLKGEIDTGHMFSDFKRFGESINNVNNGLTMAVNEKMKSERFKTELITNVSHDIKTPLTSIINYVDLIKKEKPENEKIRDYISVLDRQSGRLKKLIEDLVEASKASTGNLSVNLLPCELGVLLVQTAGEYEEKLKNNNLELVIKGPDYPVNVLADGRHMWRVIDNLMNNICKYSQPSTRVYVSLEIVGELAVITFKNISRTQLNISSDELMERFVRGDSSRNTEGSGLGLSITKSLMELQNGKMRLDVDGDLFKVVLELKINR